MSKSLSQPTACATARTDAVGAREDFSRGEKMPRIFDCTNQRKMNYTGSETGGDNSAPNMGFMEDYPLWVVAGLRDSPGSRIKSGMTE